LKKREGEEEKEAERVSEKETDASCFSFLFSFRSSGHVDAGKSTLMGRLLYELGVLSEKEKLANERGSEKMGKSSFQYAWALDGTVEERERLVLLWVFFFEFLLDKTSISVLGSGP